MIHDTWSGCAWMLARVCYPLTVFGWWLRHGDMFRPWTPRRFGPMWWRRVLSHSAGLLLWATAVAAARYCW